MLYMDRAFFCILDSGGLNIIFLQVGGPIEARYREWEERGPAIEQLAYCIRSFREAALSSDPKFEHIDISEKQKVLTLPPIRGLEILIMTVYSLL